MTVSSSTQQHPQSLQSYLRWRVPACLPGEPLVHRIVELTDVVWIIELEGDERVVAKHQVCGADTKDQPDDMLAVEPRILDLLVGEGCSVPRVLGVDPETFFIFYEYRGDRTVDDLCQQQAPRAVGGQRDLWRQLVTEFCQIESTLATHQRELEHMVTATARIEELSATAARVEAGALEGLAKMHSLCGTDAPAVALDSVRELSRRLSARAPTLGSTDYNARNIVVDGGLEGGALLTFIEFARIGWDWPERRLVQYATSLGAGRPDGRFISLIGPDTVNCYARWGGGDAEGRAAALDGHHILFHLNAAAMLFRALDAPHLPRHRALLDAWRNPEQRAAQIVEAICAPLTGDRLCSRFREMFASAMTHVSGRFGHE